MKLRVLNYRMAATHGSMSSLNSLNDPISISDFDAFVCDLAGLSSDAIAQPAFLRRQGEIRDLVHRKGGIVVCFLRPDEQVAMGFSNRYGLLSAAAPASAGLVRSTVLYGTGSQVKLVRSARGASAAYFQVLRGALRFEAHLSASEEQVETNRGTIFAVDSAGYPIAVEFAVAEGRICFLPLPDSVPPERTGAAFYKVITAHFNKITEIDAPMWIQDISVPGANAYDGQIAALTKRSEEIAIQIAALNSSRDELQKYVRLLFSYGKAVLEPVVRSALTLLGFAVAEPEEYEGEWDVQAEEPVSGRTALGEVEGSDGPIDVDKYRQLLDYIEAEALEGREHKGILIGNGFRQLPPEATERQNQFTDHAQRGAARNRFCLLPTTELFKAVCAVLESPDEGFKAAIRDSLLNATGPWSFALKQDPERKLLVGQNIE
ncbi:MAG: hypothetical protein WB919_07810 [Candidatus Sulfotelmatobacter sp.]